MATWRDVSGVVFAATCFVGVAIALVRHRGSRDDGSEDREKFAIAVAAGLMLGISGPLITPPLLWPFFAVAAALLFRNAVRARLRESERQLKG